MYYVNCWSTLPKMSLCSSFVVFTIAKLSPSLFNSYFLGQCCNYCKLLYLTPSGSGVRINDKGRGGVFRTRITLKSISEKFSPLKSKFLRTYFIVLKSSMGIFRKSQKVSARHLDPKGVKKGVLSDPGPEDPLSLIHISEPTRPY